MYIIVASSTTQINPFCSIIVNEEDLRESNKITIYT